MHLLDQSAFLKMLGWALFNSIWQMSLLWLTFIVVASAGAKKFSSNAKHNIASLLLGIGSLWFFITLAANCFNHDLPYGVIIAANIFSANKISFLDSWKHFISNLIPYCSLAYLIALGFLLIRYFKYYTHSQHLKLASLHKAPVDVRVFAESVTKRIGIHKTVVLWLSAAIQSPMTIGFFKPVILIPLATINHLSTQQMEAVILHELAHIERNDYLLNLMVTLTEVIFFFNPFSMLLVHAIRRERENSCDDLVMQFRYDPCTYASALLSLEKARHHEHRLAMAAVGKNNKMLLQRVMRLTGQKKRADLSVAKYILIAVMAVSIALASVMQLQHNDRKLVAYKKVYGSPKISLPEQNELKFGGGKPLLTRKNEKAHSKGKSLLVSANAANDKFSNENDMVLVSNNEDQDFGNSQTINQAIVEEPRVYSIGPSVPIAPPTDIFLNDHPYIPSVSFSYTETEDSNVAKPSLSQLDAEKNMRSATRRNLGVANQLNLERLEGKIKLNGSELYIEKLQNEIRKSLREADWDKISEEEAETTADENDEKRMRQDLKVQLQTLADVRYKDLQKAQKIQQQILQQQYKIQQASIKKQQQLIKQVEEIRKKIKIVYI